MNETLKRGISGSVYIGLLLTCIHYTSLSYFVLFGFLMNVLVLKDFFLGRGLLLMDQLLVDNSFVH